MKNNQFRAYITKYMDKAYNNAIVLSVDIDSNTRRTYLYTRLSGHCIGSFTLYFTNEYVNIGYSKTNEKACKVPNIKESRQFDYCQLREVIFFLDKAVKYFIEGGKYAKN